MSFSIDDQNDNANNTLKNIGYQSQKLNEIIEKLQETYTSEDIINKADTFKKILNCQDILYILAELSRRNLEDIIVYILNEFSISAQETQKEKLYLDLYLLAIKKGQLKVLESLDKLELNFSKMLDREENTGLILAVIFSDIQIAKFFLKRCPDMLEQPNSAGYTPLILAVYNNDNLMFFLLANNLISPITDGNTLCELAIRNENLEILTYLNPEINKAKCIYTPSQLLLHFAACQSDMEIFNMVAKMVKVYDYQIASSLETPLHWAVMRGNFNIVKALVTAYKDRQIDIDIKNVNGVTPFYLANIRQDKNICKLLFDNGANANESDKEGNSIVHMLAALGDVNWLRYAIKKFNVNCYLKNEKGDTPFMLAILNENVAVVEFFLELFKNSKGTIGSNINWRNKYGQTPLHAAVFTGNVKILEMLLKVKADIKIKDVNDLTPYHYAYIEEKENIIQVIHKILGVVKSDFIKEKL